MDRTWATWPKIISKKYLSKNKLYLVAHGTVLVVGVWLAVVAFIMRDLLYCLLFVVILSVVYALTAFQLYRTTRPKEESQTRKQESRVHLTGLPAIHSGEDGIKLTIPRRFS
jgi:FlaA1/EpsC-like NDP-sugar epimerase